MELVRQIKIIAVIVTVAVLSLILNTQTTFADGSTDLQTYWKKGIRFKTSDKAFTFNLGGRIMNDFAIFGQDDDIKEKIGDLESGTEFRRTRLYLSGALGKIIFKAQFDFSGGDADFKDVYIGMKKLPGLGTLKVGHFYETFGLESLTSSKYITFMERALPVAFNPTRNTGIGISNAVLDKKLTYSAGAFIDSGAYGNGTTKGSTAFTGRITGLPVSEKDVLLHMGVAASYRSYSDDDDADNGIRFRERPESHIAQHRFVDTGTISADSEIRYGTEIAFRYGSVSVQTEYIATAISGADGADDFAFSGFYGFVSYFITGEHRPYKNTAGSFSRIKPKSNFSKGGFGAFEVALRYSSINLNDGVIEGGELNDITAGLNWYLNPNVRFMLNYVRADLKDVGVANIGQTRFQIDF